MRTLHDLALKFAADFKTSLQDLKAGKIQEINRSYLIKFSLGETSRESLKNNVVVVPPPVVTPSLNTPQAPLLSIVVDDFLMRYDSSNKAMLVKLNATLPIFIELVGDKSVNQILQADLNLFFDGVQKLPIRRDAQKFKDMSIKQIIAANVGQCIAEKTFKRYSAKELSTFSTFRTGLSRSLSLYVL